jgi:hypothetical protein
VLRLIEDWSEREVADALGIAVGTVKSRLSRALDEASTGVVMTMEERIVRELKAERSLVPAATPADMPSVPSRWPRYVGLAAALAAVVMGGLWLVNLRSSSLDDLVAAADADGEITIDGEVVPSGAGEPGRIDVRAAVSPYSSERPLPSWRPT